MEPRIQAAIFDLDGTLLDSMGMWARLDVEFLRRRGLPEDPEYVRAVTGMNYQEAAQYTIVRYQLAETPDELMREWNLMAQEEYRANIPLKAYAREFLHALRERDILLGVATASPAALYEPALKRNGVYDLFSSFTTVTEVSRGKGFPDIYLLEAERLGVPPQHCVVFEDVLPGVRGARAAGMKVVAVRDASSAHHEEELKQLSNFYANGFEELLARF